MAILQRERKFCIVALLFLALFVLLEQSYKVHPNLASQTIMLQGEMSLDLLEAPS